MGSDISKYSLGLASLILLWIGKSKSLIGLLAILLIISTENTFGQAVWESSATAVGSGTGSGSVTRPTGTTTGDLLIAGFMFESGTDATLSIPTGWTLIRRTDQSSNVGMATYFRIATSGEPASYAFRASGKWAVGISRISGANQTSPIAVSNGNSSSSSSTSVVAPTVTTTAANQLVLAFYTNKKNGTYIPDSGTTERYDAPNTSEGIPSNMLATYVQAAAGTTGTKTATASESETWVAQQIVVNEPIIEISETITTVGNGTYNVPAGVTSLRIQAWGGGGRGGSATSNGGMGGGGGGAYASSVLTVTPSSSIPYFVGSGGSGTNTNGGRTTFGPPSGQTASISNNVQAAGGIGVLNNTSQGGAGGGAQNNPSVGQITQLGGSGATGVSSGPSTRGGGGGSSAGINASGVNGSGVTGGTAPEGGGNGGSAGGRGSNGGGGSPPGGGGAGASRNGTNTLGGNGGNGQIRISYQASLTVSSPNDINVGTRAEYTITRNGPTTAAATVNLSSSGATGGQFFAAASGGTAITSISIPVGSTSVTVYFTGNAGTHTVNFASPGYLPASDVLVINQPASTVTIKSGTSNSFTYTGSAQGPGVNDFDFTGSQGTRSVLYTGVSPTSYNSATPPTNAGTYQVVASVAADANFGSANSSPFAFAITRATVTITPDAGQSKSLGGPDPVLTFQSSGWLGSDNAALLQGALSRAAGEAAGFYPITLGNLTETSGNYLLALTAGIQFEIKPGSTVTIKSGTSNSYTFTGTAQGPGINDFTFTGSSGAQTILYSGTGSTVYNSATPPTNAGTYQVVASVAADTNFGSANSSPFTFTITRVTVTITPNAGQSKFIGGSDPVLTFQSSGWLGSDNAALLQGALSRAAGEAAGFYPITLGNLTETSGNYLLALTAGIQFEIRIDPSMPVVQGTATFQNSFASNSHSVTLPSNIQAGDLLVMVLRPGATLAATTPNGWTLLSSRSSNGVSYVFFRTASGSEGSTQSISLSNNGSLAAITYRISNWEGTPEAAVAGSNTNNPPSITTSWDASPTLFIAAMTNRRTDNDVTGAPSGFSNLLTIANSLSTNNAFVRASTAVREENTKTIDPAGFSTSGTIDNPHSFTIAIKGKRKVLTVVANPLSKVYGQPDPELTYTVTGFQGADNESILTGSLSRTSGQNVGTYTISQGNLAAADYIIEFTGANFSITPKTLSITPDSGQFKIVGESDPESLTFQTSGFEFSDNNSLLTGSLLRAAGESPGFYPITQGTLNVTSGNYTLQFTSGIQFEIRSNPSRYIVTASTTNPRAGTAVAISAQLADVNGSAIPEAGRTVTWSELIGTSGTFSSATSVTNAQGIATVQFTTSSTIGISTKITVAGSGGLFGTSPEITTVDAVPTQLVFVQDPSGSSTVAGEAFATQPIVHILDEEGNLASSANKQITLSLSEGSGELRGNINLNAVNGVATFAGLNIDLVGSDKIILAESEGLASATTSAFTITPAPASLFTKYAGDQQAAQVGTAVGIAPAVRVQDVFGNPISGVSVSFAVTSGGGSIEPTTAVLTNEEGIASLISWTLGPLPGQNTLTASASGFSTLTFTALGSENLQISDFPNNTWTVPPGVTEITVEAWGAGGGGGGVREGSNRVGAGGGGGAYTKSILTVTPGQILNISIGTGGTAGSSTVDGGSGGDSRVSFNSSDLVRAKGGIGGQSRTSGNSTPKGGAGGRIDESIGDTITAGGNGLNGSGTGGSTGAGGNGANGGAGGTARSTAGNGNPGSAPGGGGGGGRDNDSSGSRSGGSGGSGRLIITYPQPVNQFRAATSGNWEDENTWEQQFSNGQFAKINSKPAANSNAVISAENIKVTVSDDLSVSGSITVVSDGELVLASGKNLTLNPGSTLSIGNEGILTLPSDGLVLGAGNLAINKGSTLAIAHPEGIKALGTPGGAIQNTGTRTFSAEADYIYNGTVPQVIGTGLPEVVNDLELENPTTVTLDRPLRVAVDLEVNTGTLELDETLTVDLDMELNGSSSVLVKEGKTLQAELLSNISTNNNSKIILQPGAKYFNLGISAPRLEVRQNLTGTRGWRMMGAPVRETTYLDFLGEIESQGFPGSIRPNLQPNVLWWDETDAGTTAQGWRQPANISQQVSSGRGHYVFVFGGAKLPGGSSESYSDVLPLTVATTGQELNLNSGGFNFGITYTPRIDQLTNQNNNFNEVSTTDAGFNLISNPTASYIDFQKASGWQKTNIDQTIYIWNQNRNNGNGGFELFQGSDPANLIAPFQAFWIKANAPNPILTMNNEAKSFATSSFFGRVIEESPKTEALKIKLNVSSARMEAESILRFSPEGKDEKDEWDAYQLESLGNNWLLLYSYGSPKENTPLAINHLSLPQEAEEKSIPLNLAAAWEGKPFGDDYLLTWELPAAWPSNQKVVLMDHISEKAIDMGKISEYRFNFKAPTSSNTNLRIDGQGMKSPQAVVFSSPFESGNPNARVNPESPKRPFTIVIGYQGTGTEPEYRPEMPKLFTPYPNPFIDRTRIKFYLPMTATAEIKIFDTNGMTVGQFDAAEYLAGVHELDWAPAGNRLPAGIYVLQLITGENVLTQKLLKK
ncbi:T9SS type A sorting domain-containing protein [Aquiflexum sp. LQ15W]|uniref:MBG domain-containing protein n=1 Tax=Cognataquiflexum nitidum TaxID=2922272 RepID=UPI001F12BD36|nr:MBG domain-containing protein [Cognataquiflexum nitidum]MCH6199884.1 T9SS type A sorting domain-containing protein [Cognataquiflexum nitidum]